MKKKKTQLNLNTVTKTKSGDKQPQPEDRRLMQLAIQASVALSVIGAIMIGILLYYHKQTACVWVTFTTILLVTLSFCLYWQSNIWENKGTLIDPFSVEVSSATVSDSGPLTLYMVTYPSMFGETASPIFYLTYLQITNLQDIACTITEFTVYASKNTDGPWEQLVPIPLPSTNLFALGITTPSPKRLVMGHGTYRLGTTMTINDMKHAALLIAEPALESEFSKPIQPHSTIGGWVAFDSPTHKGLTPGQIYFRVKLRDTANMTKIFVVPLPIKHGVNSSMEISNSFLTATGKLSDISRFKVRYYSDPYPTPQK